MFRNNNGKVEDAMEHLNALSAVDIHGSDISQTTDSAAEIGNCDQNQATCESRSSILLPQFTFSHFRLKTFVCWTQIALPCQNCPGSQMWEETHEDQNDAESKSSFEDSIDGVKWVELFVNEMMNAANIDDARGRAARILGAFERCISEQTRVSNEVV